MRIVTIALALISLTFVPARPAHAAVTGFDASYFGESNFLSVGPGQTGQFVVIFTNTGGQTWQRASGSQVNLAICLPDKVTCNVPSPNARWNDGSWLSSIAYATHNSDVAPTQNGYFVYSIRVPLDTTAGVYWFHGDLVLGSTLAKIHPAGYFQNATCTCDPGPP